MASPDRMTTLILPPVVLSVATNKRKCGLMSLLLNPGENTIGGTRENAIKEAKRLLECMKEDGITDVELVKVLKEVQGRFVFTYVHKITGRTGTWDLTGLEWEEEWKKRGHVFPPRMYWNGSSCAVPKWEDFLTAEYELRAVKKGQYDE